MKDNAKYCPECQVGVFRSSEATYFTWIDDEIITVPNFPCWVCDVCGRRDWDSQALMQLNILLSPNAGNPVKHVPSKCTPEIETESPKRIRRRRAVS